MPKSQEADCVEHLHHLDKSQISELWRELFKNQPRVELRNDLILRIVAQRLQEVEFGALREPAIRSLRNLTNNIATNGGALVSRKSPIKSGTRMVRQWKDQVHVVNVEGQRFEYRGDQYKSLSEIARRITGTRWSGPLFFGVKQNTRSAEAQ